MKATIHEQINHATNVKARIEDYIVELNSMEDYVAPSDVVNRLNSIFARAEDAAFELKCRQADSAS
jgi:hypothetical protein